MRSSAKSRTAIEAPERMAHLERDHRGYPIPFNVLRQMDGKPLFTINDERKAARCISELLCPICGEELEVGGMWFFGGPLSAFHEHGAYFDQPMHRECMEYAAQVCPYLAAPKYMGRLDDKGADLDGLGVKALLDPTVIPDRPDFFVGVRSISYSAVIPPSRIELPKLIPVRPYLDVQFWLHGERITQEEAMALAEKSSI